MGFLDTLDDIDEMSEKGLRDEVDSWRKLWTWVPENVQDLVVKSGGLMRVVGRNYAGHMGFAQGWHFTLEAVDVGVIEEHRDYSTGETHVETKTIRVPISSLTHMEFIENRERVEREEEEEEIVEPSELVAEAAEILEGGVG